MKQTIRRPSASAALIGALALTFSACGLDRVEIPGISGPSELGTSIEPRIFPDIVLADGIQTAALQVIVRGPNGAFVAGRDVVFTIQDEQGRTAEIGTLTSPTGARVFGATTARTGANGIAQVIYTTPERRDLTADIRLIIGMRLVGTDANGATNTTVRLDVRSAEPRRFPQIPGNDPPTCSFNMAPNDPAAPAGTVIRVNSTASDRDGFITRYEWYWGDGSRGDEGIITAQHPYPFPGTYTITHIVTDNAGASVTCTAPIRILP